MTAVTVVNALAEGRAWFATRPQFYASHEADLWHCRGFVCRWERNRWVAWKHEGPARPALTPAAALAAVGYIDPKETP